MVKKRASFSLEKEYVQKLKEIAALLHTDQTATMRRLIDEAANKLGLEPVAPLTLLSAAKKKTPA